MAKFLTKEAIRNAAKSGIEMIGVAIDSSASNFVKEAYPIHYDYSGDIDSFVKKFPAVYIKGVMRNEL